MRRTFSCCCGGGSGSDSDGSAAEKNGKSVNRFDLEFLRRSLLIHRLLFPSWRSAQAALAAALLALGAAEQVVGYYVGLITSDYYQARERHFCLKSRGFQRMGAIQKC